METVSNKSKNTIPKRIIISWLLGLFALALAGYMGEISEKYWQFTWQSRAILQALIMAGIVGFGIWLLRRNLDKYTPKSIGMGGWKSSSKQFLLGIGLILAPILITIFSSFVFGLNAINFNLNSEILKSSVIGLGIVFLFEAFPEELIFRGYIYSNLNTKYKRWVSSIITILLFALLPIILVPIQKHVLGMDVYIGGSNTVTISYVITMVFFGAFQQYLRVITRSIWAGIGFHTMFVYFDRIMGTTSDHLVQFDTSGSETPMQIIFIGSLLLIFLAIILYPIISKKPIGWKEIQK